MAHVLGIVVRVSIRVLVAGLPPLTADVISDACRRSPGLDLIGVLPWLQPVELGRTLASTPVDALVLGVADHGESISRIKVDHPWLALIGVSPDGARAWSVELRADLIEVEPVSPVSIRRVIHEQCQPSGTVR